MDINNNKKFLISVKLIIRLNSQVEVYASPELLRCLREKDTQKINIIDHHKNDVFCLGLCFLELGLLRSVDKVITRDKLIDQNRLKEYLSAFKNTYETNSLLVSSVRKMLELHPERRPSFIGKSTIKNLI